MKGNTMFATPQIIQQGQNYHVQHGTDQGLFVQFYMEAIKNEEESLAQGRPIFNDREFIKIIPVGDRNTVICEPVTEEHRHRFANQYAAFKNQQIQPQSGTPLEEWAPLTKSQVMTMKAVNVHTVEQLAAVSDGNLTNLGMGARELREKAIVYIETAQSNAMPLAAQQKINDLEKQVEALKNQLAGFERDPEVAKKRGRPRKEDLDA
jgi:hypothetical protein